MTIHILLDFWDWAIFTYLGWIILYLHICILFKEFIKSLVFIIVLLALIGVPSLDHIQGQKLICLFVKVTKESWCSKPGIIVFLKNGILLPKLFWPIVRKNCSTWSRKTFEIQGWRPRICKNFEITRTICSNSERSEQFWVTECFFNLFLEVSQI